MHPEAIAPVPEKEVRGWESEASANEESRLSRVVEKDPNPKKSKLKSLFQGVTLGAMIMLSVAKGVEAKTPKPEHLKGTKQEQVETKRGYQNKAMEMLKKDIEQRQKISYDKIRNRSLRRSQEQTRDRTIERLSQFILTKPGDIEIRDNGVAAFIKRNKEGKITTQVFYVVDNDKYEEYQKAQEDKKQGAKKSNKK